MNVSSTPRARRTAHDSLVLYVEDQPVNVMLMQALFDRLPGTRLLVATSGGEALAMSVGQHTDLLLLDISLPDCRGTELLPMLRSLPGCRDSRAIAVTAEPDFRIEGTGFDELWHKPIDLPRVLARLQQLLDGHGPLPGVPPAGLVSRRRWASKAFA